MAPETLERLVAAVRSFAEFDRGNDPYDEHDFGSVRIDGETIYWKIDYYNESLSAGSEAPWDSDQCARVMTIMLANEY